MPYIAFLHKLLQTTMLNQLWHLLQGEGLYLFYRLLYRTTKLTFEGKEHFEEVQASGRPLLWIFWHQQVVPAALAVLTLDKMSRYSALMVGDDRALTLAHTLKRLGTGPAHPVNMNGNPVAAGKAVLQLIKAMKGGYRSVMAPDGPDGPAFVPKDGVFFLAQKTEAAVIPFGAYSHPAIQLNRWDRYLLPLPFTSVSCVFDKPIWVNSQTDKEMLKEQFVAAMNRAREKAEKITLSRKG